MTPIVVFQFSMRGYNACGQSWHSENSPNFLILGAEFMILKAYFVRIVHVKNGISTELNIFKIILFRKDLTTTNTNRLHNRQDSGRPPKIKLSDGYYR